MCRVNVYIARLGAEHASTIDGRMVRRLFAIRTFNQLLRAEERGPRTRPRRGGFRRRW